LCPSQKVLFSQAALEGGIEREIGIGVVGLQGQATLLAMNVAFDVQVVDLGNAK
jgi:hypothetical protein